MKKFTIVIEKDGEQLSAWIDQPGYFFLSTVGSTQEEVTQNIRSLIADYIEHEGLQFAEWRDVRVADIKFMYEINLSAFFDTFSVIKINAIADLSGINRSLVRQYATGAKNASKAQVQKIETAVHQLAESLLRVRFV